MRRAFSGEKRDWAMFKADHEASYKQLPMLPRDRQYAILA